MSLTNKHTGQVFTPNFIVKNILDFADYNNENILKKSIIDNSCGDGAFLCEIVERYINTFLQNNQNKEQLKQELETYIVGIEIDSNSYNNCIKNLNKVAEKYNLFNVKWNIHNDNTLSVYQQYLKKYDFVVGNPPYVRIHNTDDNIKEFLFSNKGMSDLYLTFFEIGLKMLSENGKMCLITPSSFLTSKAGENFRQYIKTNHNLEKIVDLEHFQPFEDITTYTIITLLQNNKYFNKIDYYKYNEENKQPYFVDKLNYTDCFIKNELFFLKTEELRKLNRIYQTNIKTDKIDVKNGYATLCDKVFIGDFDFDNTIDVVKASTGEKKKCLFPYNKQCKPVNKQEIENSNSYKYLLQHKEELLNRDIEDKENWFLFGRTQAINDTYKDKITINQIIKDKQSLKLKSIKSGTGVYGGLYIITNNDFEKIKSVIINDEFIEYVKALKKFKSGGYYTFSSSDLKKYLVYKLYG